MLMSWDIQRASGGRFILGLGSQVKGHVQRRYSAFWSGHAQPQMKEYIQALKAIWRTWETGEKLDVRGEYYTHTLMTPEFNPGPVPGGAPKVVGHPQKILLAVRSCAWISRPMTGSKECIRSGARDPGPGTREGGGGSQASRRPLF